MCKYCSFKMNTHWGENIDCTDYDNTDADVGMYMHYSDLDKAYYLMTLKFIGSAGHMRLSIVRSSKEI